MIIVIIEAACGNVKQLNIIVSLSYKKSGPLHLKLNRHWTVNCHRTSRKSAQESK